MRGGLAPWSCVRVLRPCARPLGARWAPRVPRLAWPLWGVRATSTARAAGELPPLPGSGGLTSLSPNILLRCTILDSHGSVRTISGLFRKTELCAHHGLEPRDLRKIDSRVPNVVPTILARRSAILVNILHIRAMVKSDAVLLFDSYTPNDSRLHSAFVYNLEHNLCSSASSQPYEFRALESILVSVLDALRTELGWLRLVAEDLLDALDDDIDREKLRMLLQISRKLHGFLSRSRGVRVAVTEVLDNNEDMALMYLSAAKRGEPKTKDSPMEELELLLESFEKQVEEVVSEIEQIYANVNNTQEIVELMLDNNRNRLLMLDLGTSIGMLGVSFATLFVGLFGMNLTSHLEAHPLAFYVASGAAYLMALVVTVVGLCRLRRMRRVGLAVGPPSHDVLDAPSTRKPDAHLVSHARAWWWRENQFRAMRRERSARDAAAAPWDSTRMPLSGEPLDPAELNGGPAAHVESAQRPAAPTQKTDAGPAAPARKTHAPPSPKT